METRQKQLLEFVKIGHFTQRRKYTDEPYFTHVLRVGLEARKQEVPFGYEIGVCHDLFEDTKLQSHILSPFLLAIGYTVEEINQIIAGVIALTDEYIKEKYPDLSRKERKLLEIERLALIPADFQTIKYIDCIDNCHSICQHDSHFSMTYLKEIMALISVMNQGNPEILKTLTQLLIVNLAKYGDEGQIEW